MDEFNSKRTFKADTDFSNSRSEPGPPAKTEKREFSVIMGEIRQVSGVRVKKTPAEK
jgi:hypothetical protein